MAEGKVPASKNQTYQIGTVKTQAGGGDGTPSVKRYVKKGVKPQPASGKKKSSIKGKKTTTTQQSAKKPRKGKTANSKKKTTKGKKSLF